MITMMMMMMTMMIMFDDTQQRSVAYAVVYYTCNKKGDGIPMKAVDPEFGV